MSSIPVESAASVAERLRAEVSETHTSVVIFIGDRAYKIKKPVDLGFLDFSKPAARRAACEREITLNRRFSPDVYEGLAEIRFPWGGPPESVVVMRRMPAACRLAHLVNTGAPVDNALRKVARLLATCHADSRRDSVISKQGTRDALLSRWEASFEQIRGLGGEAPPCGVAEVERLVRRYLAGRDSLFEARIREGRVVDGHGDLLTEDIFCLDDGPRVLDCLEFEDSLRYVDGLDDAAFLTMDLERIGAPDAATFFLDRYTEFSGDPAPSSLRHHYVAYRAFVRAKVALFQAQQGIPVARSEAERLTNLALRHLRTSAVRLILVGGQPASGKSTLAGALADRLGLTLLSSDRLRKEQAGIAPDHPAPSGFETGIYTPERTQRAYDELIERTSALLSLGESVVIDASWTAGERRNAAAEAARRCHADLVPLHCEVPHDLADHRLNTRQPGPSDADPSIAEAMATAADPWPEAVIVDTGGKLEAAVQQALAVIHPEGTGQARLFRRSYMEPD